MSMMSKSSRDLLLFEDDFVGNFFPLCETRPLGELRIGISTLIEKWQKHLSGRAGHCTRPHLRAVHQSSTPFNAVYVNARAIPDQRLIQTIGDMTPGELLVNDKTLLAWCGDIPQKWKEDFLSGVIKRTVYEGEVLVLSRITDLFAHNDQLIRRDFESHRLRTSQTFSPGNVLIGSERDLFIEAGASIQACTINTSTGPVYIGHGAEVMEGSMIRGPFVLGDYSTLKMGAKIYGATTIGPHCKVGGEVSNSVILGYSNKAHDGFLGNSILGEWCNLGADTNNSNLKNNYGKVTLWNDHSGTFEDTDLTFCGLVMGDHSKCGINTMFNTGTVIGTSCNLFGGGFMPRFVPSFSWGDANHLVEYEFDKAMDTAEKVMERRQMILTAEYRAVLRHIADSAQRFHTDRIKS